MPKKLSWVFSLPNRKIRIAFIVSLGLNIASWLMALFATMPYYGKEDFMALHKTVYFGVDWLGPWREMFFLPIVGLFFIAINFFISQYVWRKDEDLGYLIFCSTIFFELFIILAVFGIARLNL